MRSRWWPIWWCLVVVAGGLLARRSLLVVSVDGSSMLPTYADGDRLLAVRPPLGRRVRVGDVVVVTAPAPSGATDRGRSASETLVKRVRGIESSADGPNSRIFVQGDNPPSYDSHTFGSLAPTAIIGRVVRVLSTS